MVALHDPVEQPRERVRAADRVRRGAGARPRRRYRDRRVRRVQHRHRHQGRDRKDPRGRRGLRRTGRRAVESVSARARSRARVPRGRHAGRHRRVPCLRLHLDAAEAAARSAGGARSRRHAVRRRGRGPHGRPVARCRRRRREADLQLSRRHARNGGRHAADPAGAHRDARQRELYQLRCRARLPVPVLLLHHHQRAGPQVALPHAGRRRGDRAGERRAGHHPILRHRRQFRAQQELGADPRPAHSPARERGLQDPPAAAGRHAVPPHPRLHREGGARGLQRGVHRAGEHQSRNPCSAPRSGRTRSGSIARCSRPGASRR